MDSMGSTWTVDTENRSPISSLPPEILSRIFYHFVPASLAIDDNFDADCGNPGWNLDQRLDYEELVHLTHVCRTWRQAALSNSTFWNKLWITNGATSRNACEALLERSGSTPLEVVVRDEVNQYKRHYGGAILRMFQMHIPCPLDALLEVFPSGPLSIKLLRIVCPIRINDKRFFEMQAPELESFTIDNTVEWSSRTPFQIFKLPTRLFGNCTPVLRRVSLDKVLMSWDSLIFKNLTVINVSDWEIGTFERNNGGNVVHFMRLLQILRDCPNIVTLRLCHTGPMLGDQSADSTVEEATLFHDRRVHLPFLQNLTLLGLANSETCLALLACLRIPTLRNFSTSHHGMVVKTNEDVIPSSLSFHPELKYSNCAAVIVDSEFAGLDIRISNVQNLDERWRVNEDPSLLTAHDDESNFPCSFKYDACDNSGNSFDNFVELGMAFIRRVCPRKIRALSICNSASSLDALPFTELFELFSGIECIEIWEDGQRIKCEEFFKFLKSIADTPKHHVDVLPSLTALTFEHVEFTKDSLGDLNGFLSHRFDQKNEIGYLSLTCCLGVGRDELTNLGSVVGRLVSISDSHEDEELESNE